MRRPRRQTCTLAVAALLALALGAPADAQRRAAVLGHVPSPAGRACTADPEPRQVPAPGTLVDVAALPQVLGGSGPEGDALFSLRFGEDGSPVWVRLLGSDHSPERRAVLEAELREHLLPQARARRPWGVRLRVTEGGAGVETGRSELCAVEVVASGSIGSTVVTVTGPQLKELENARPPRITVGVGRGGEVRYVRLTQSSGSRIHDGIVEEAARTNRYLPALVDGMAVEGTYHYPPARGIHQP